ALLLKSFAAWEARQRRFERRQILLTPIDTAPDNGRRWKILDAASARPPEARSADAQQCRDALLGNETPHRLRSPNARPVRGAAGRAGAVGNTGKRPATNIWRCLIDC